MSLKFLNLIALGSLSVLLFCSPTVLGSNSSNSKGDKPAIISFLGDKDPPAKVNDHILSTDPKDIKFYYYSNPGNVREYRELFINDTNTLAKSQPPEAGRHVKILIHGYLHGPGSFFPQNVKNASLTQNRTTGGHVIVVGWSALSTVKYWWMPQNLVRSYTTAAIKNLNVAGNQIASFIGFLVDNGWTSLDMIQLIGHSIGAPLAGTVGHFLQKRYGQLPARITGLDPAGPLFYTNLAGRPLSKDDAQFVDIVHTADGTYGKLDFVQKGHADFYSAMGMMIQPGCRRSPGTIAYDIMTLGVCSHYESTVLYSKSVGSTALTGCKCSNYLAFRAGQCPCTKNNATIFGDNANPKTRGKFYLKMDKA